MDGMVSGGARGWLRAEGKTLRNGDGEEVILRGVGLGGWLLPEGYMLRLPAPADRPRRIWRMVEELAGADYAAGFRARFRERHVTEDDIARIAREGLNSVRVPLSALDLTDGAGHLDPTSPALLAVDRVLRACERHGVWAILDLHAAPGGQTGSNIDDSERDLPELFTGPANADRTVALWRDLAERYANEWIVAGYDLLNEPLPEAFARHNSLLLPLYGRIVAAIREVDPRHLLILEGTHWATDLSIFERPLDGNALYEFHKYWSAPDAASLRPFLEARERLDAPIFMGEGGENNLDWYAGLFPLLEEYDISWNFWTWKKMDADNAPCSVTRPRGWERIVSWLEGGEKPGPEEAMTLLDAYLEGLLLERCAWRPGVVDAILRRPPARIPAMFFEHGAASRASRADQHAGVAGFREGEGFDLRFLDGAVREAHFRHGGGEPWKDGEWICLRLHPGERFRWRFTVPAGGSGMYRVDARVRAVVPGAVLSTRVDGTAFCGHAIAAAAFADQPGLWRGALSPGTRFIEMEAPRGEVELLWLRPVAEG